MKMIDQIIYVGSLGAIMPKTKTKSFLCLIMKVAGGRFRNFLITKMKNPYIKWKSIECPRQPLGTNDCGYYVCRYMIEIIESRQLIPDKYFDKVHSTYSQQMIDELREMWISYVSENDQPGDDDDDDIFEL